MSEAQSNVMKKKRPVALTVIAIIGTIYAASGLAGAAQSAVIAPILVGMGGIMNRMYGSIGSASMPDFQALYGGFVPWMLLLAGIGLPIFLFGLIACIGALKNKPWTRAGVTVFAVLLFAEVAVTAIALFGMMSPFLADMERMIGPASGYGESLSSFWTIYSTIIKATLVISLPLNCVLPTILLVFMNKPAVKDHYRALKGAAA
jgi:hypothetical protein